MNTDLTDLTFWKRAAALLAVVALFALAGARDADDAEITAKLEAEAAERLPCERQWIAQSGPGEPAVVVCIVADLSEPRELPPHILTMPVGQ